jgi:hypothetical protein
MSARFLGRWSAAEGELPTLIHVLERVEVVAFWDVQFGHGPGALNGLNQPLHDEHRGGGQDDDGGHRKQY